MNSLPMLRLALRSRAPALTPRLHYSTAPTPSAATDSSSSSEASSSASSSSSSSSSSTTKPPPRSAVLDQVAEGLRASKKAGSSNSSFTPGSARSASRSDTYRWQDHFQPSSSSARSQPARAAPTPEDNWRTSQIVGYSAPITTTTARSFEVKGGDVGRAFRMLNRTLRENNVRRELKRQERFESGSDKRVRLDSERHRKRFKVAVGKAVSLAMRMKDM